MRRLGRKRKAKMVRHDKCFYLFQEVYSGIGVNPLQGVLGKTSGRSYKAAPRQLLQVEPVSSTSPAPSPRVHDEQLPSLSEHSEQAAPQTDIYHQVYIFFLSIFVRLIEDRPLRLENP